MLWDMVRYANYDVNSPYNREAAHWAKTQKQFGLPLDVRPLRNRVAAEKLPRKMLVVNKSVPDIQFLGDVTDADVVDAEVIESDPREILIIE
jgi:hypothetical protein